MSMYQPAWYRVSRHENVIWAGDIVHLKVDTFQLHKRWENSGIIVIIAISSSSYFAFQFDAMMNASELFI